MKELAARLRKMLAKEVRLTGLLEMDLDEIAPLAGDDTEAVLVTLQRFEAQHPWWGRGYGYERKPREKVGEVERRINQRLAKQERTAEQRRFSRENPGYGLELH